MAAASFERTRPSDYLTRLAWSDQGRAYKSLALTELDITTGSTVVDLGCGPGADLPALADKTGPTGTVLALDHDEQAVQSARSCVEHLPNVRVEGADIHSLSLPSMSVDRAHTDRVLQHVADPVAVIREAHRVLRANGRAVFVEPDWDSLVIDYPDPAVSTSYRQFITSRAIRNAYIGRQLPRIAQHAGFTISNVVALTGVFRDAGEADKVFGFHRVTSRAIAAGYLSAQAASDWLDHLSSQPFFASATLFMTVAVRASQDH